MRIVKSLLGVLVACLALFVAPGASAAPSAPDQQGDVGIQCSTWQYITDTGKPIYHTASTAYFKMDTRRNGFVNVTKFSGNWRGGNFYQDTYDQYGNFIGTVWYTSGWIYLSHIHYVRCW